MRVTAKNPQHVSRYEVFVDGVRITDSIIEADDVAHEALILVRDSRGHAFRRDDGTMFTAVVRGHVVIVGRLNAAQMVATT